MSNEAVCRTAPATPGLLKSTFNKAERTFLTGLHSNSVMDEIPEFTGERASVLKHQFDTKVSESLKSVMSRGTQRQVGNPC